MTEEDRYEGGVNEDGNPHGYGIKEYQNGDRYEGGWKDGKVHGFGKWQQPFPKERPTGFFRRSYEGGFKDDHLHGYGISIVWDGEEQKFYRKEGNFEWSHEEDIYVFNGVTCQVKYENCEWVEIPSPTSYPLVPQSSTSSDDNLIYCKGGCGRKIEPVSYSIWSTDEDDTCDECNEYSDEDDWS